MKILLYDSGIGVVPSLKYLLTNIINNEYHIEMESDLFPLGEKEPGVLKEYVLEKISLWSQKKFDRVYIICNTFSSLILEENILIPDNFYLILTINEYLANKYQGAVLATKITSKYFKKRNYENIDGSHLVSLIENENIELLIKNIKKLKFNNKYVILGCTHFSHIAFLLKRYHPTITFIDGYPLLFNELPSEGELVIGQDYKSKRYLPTFFIHKF